MANYGSSSVTVQFDNSGGALQTITQYIMDINGFDIEAVMEESNAFGTSWRESKATGVRFVGDIVVGGFYDDTATTGPNALFNAVAGGPSVATRTFTLGWGSTNTSSVETLIQKYSRRPVRDQLTRYEVTLKPTGAVTEV